MQADMKHAISTAAARWQDWLAISITLGISATSNAAHSPFCSAGTTYSAISWQAS
jgi:hypothetical protein